MTTEDQARKQLAQKRKQGELVQDTMLNRAEAELHSTGEANAIAEERARETLVQHRQHDDHVKDTMLHRAEEEMDQNG